MNRLAEATRPIMWNVPYAGLMYLLFAVSLVVMIYGLMRRVSVWRKGTPDRDRLDDIIPRLQFMLWEILTQRKVRSSFFPGLFHSLFFYSFLVFVVTTGTIALDTDFGTELFNGYLYLTLTLLSDLAGFLFLLGLGMAVWRRVATRPATLNS
ncbi:MAG: electron transporter, partial [SAR324 cluster bacterium]|nr:electron transporter [SAR324 cluster bacterium]